MDYLDKPKLIASSSAWVAATLNIFPGIGTGYLYQRRWRAYWLTSAVTILIFFYESYSQSLVDPTDPIGQTSFQAFWGILIVAIYTSIESVLCVNRNRKSMKQ